MSFVAVSIGVVALLAGFGTTAQDSFEGIRPIIGGTFEASGVVNVPGSNGVLFVDDSRTTEILWMELAPDGIRHAQLRLFLSEWR